MKTIGITGPTGAGKTTALYALTDLGAHIVDADAVYHGLLANSISLREALTARFGEHICGEGGTIDRKRLGNLVFNDPEALADLNTITHRFVGAEIDRQLREAEAGPAHHGPGGHPGGLCPQTGKRAEGGGFFSLSLRLYPGK